MAEIFRQRDAGTGCCERNNITGKHKENHDRFVAGPALSTAGKYCCPSVVH